MADVRLGGRPVGDGHPCLIVLEPGATHTGLESAKRLAKAVSAGGADAIKFQTINSDRLMASRDLQIEYETAQGTSKESIYKALKRRELTPSQWRELKSYCDDLGLLFISTPSDAETVDLLVEMDVAAADVTFFDDQQLNVDAAKQAGMNAHRVKGIDELRACLRELSYL